MLNVSAFDLTSHWTASTSPYSYALLNRVPLYLFIELHKGFCWVVHKSSVCVNEARRAHRGARESKRNEATGER